jgi:hypothetical protein
MDKIRTFAAHCSSERRAYAITSFFFWMPMTAVPFCLAFHNSRMMGFELILDVAFTYAKKNFYFISSKIFFFILPINFYNISYISLFILYYILLKYYKIIIIIFFLHFPNLTSHQQHKPKHHPTTKNIESNYRESHKTKPPQYQNP